ncbi:MAG TPA: YceD family protein, partial [Thermoanaerobaculia bacterium]|nr:YceD family protein [Thermoanaerobaculia bacterium]
EECRGLCPHCGSDLNVSECNCVSDSVDPRWRALRLLKKE